MDSFRYLGHIISSDFKDDKDIRRETGALGMRGNLITRNFSQCAHEVKIALFKAYCNSFYTCAMWSSNARTTLQRLKVTYNNIMRRLLNVPPWHSARQMFVGIGVETMDEVIRRLVYSFRCRLECCNNDLVRVIRRSDAFVYSGLETSWSRLLF